MATLRLKVPTYSKKNEMVYKGQILLKDKTIQELEQYVKDNYNRDMDEEKTITIPGLLSHQYLTITGK